MRALRFLVAVMGVMLVVGFATLIVVIAGRVSQRQSAAPAAQLFAAPPIDVPAGARIETIAVGPDRLVVDLALPDGNRQLLIVDIATGRRLGTIPLHTAP